MSCRLFPVTPLKTIEAINIHGYLEANEHLQPVADTQAQFFSVYLRYQQNKEGFGGTECIADCEYKHEADELAGFLTTLLKLEIQQPLS